MSPVSRGRKPKKSKKSGSNKARRSRPAADSTRSEAASVGPAARLTPPRERPTWFDAAIETVLDQAERDLPQLRGPRELEQATAELLGAQLHHALHEERDGLFFDQWAAELASSAAERCREALHSGEDSWQAPWLLLHGMSAIVSPGLCGEIRTLLDRVKPGARAKQWNWPWRLPRSTATGDVWRMQDVYGTRIAILAGYSYPGKVDPSAFLFGIDASGLATLEVAGVFEDAEQAAAAWRDWIGDSAEDARVHAVDDPEQLLCLPESDIMDNHLIGLESRNVLDNWFRANRRLHDLSDALRERGMPLPAPRSLYHGIDPDPMKEEFTRWYTGRHAQPPHAEALDELAMEWLEGSIPETWYFVSPGRLLHLLALISDWIPGEATDAALALLPDWACWLGERADLPEPFMARVQEAARVAPDVAAQRV